MVKNKVSFFEIVNNPQYFDLDKERNVKIFHICLEEGYVLKDSEDLEQTKYLDAHCKCGAPLITDEYDIDKLFEWCEQVLENRRYAEMMNKLFL